jgi:hypothetical protein
MYTQRKMDLLQERKDRCEYVKRCGRKCQEGWLEKEEVL